VAPQDVNEDELDDFARMQRKFYGLDQKPEKKINDLVKPKKDEKMKSDYKCHVPNQQPIAKSPSDIRKLMEKVE
jgi:hypothetical protein